MARINITSQSSGSAGRGVNQADLVRRMSTTGWINPILGYNGLLGGWAGTTMAGAVTGALYNTTAAINDKVRYTLYFYPGTYTMYLNLSKDTDRGMVKIEIAGTTIYAAYDMYAAAPDPENTLVLTPLTITQDQTIDLDLTIVNKNGASTNYYIYCHGFEVRRIS